MLDNPPSYNQQGANTLDYLPAFVQGTAIAVPSCANGSAYQEDIAGCDQSTVYACGIVGGGAQVDLSFNPGNPSGDTSTATQCLIHQQGGQDVLDTSVFPFQIKAGAGNPMVTSGGITSGSSISSGSSIVTVPIYDDTQVPVQFPTNVNQAPVTIVGFLQVFINGVDTNGNPNVTVINVAGCSNTASTSTPRSLIVSCADPLDHFSLTEPIAVEYPNFTHLPAGKTFSAGLKSEMACQRQ